ncbi:MAG: peptidoglycan-binding protein [Oculatellaceae cyanobacterium Prado106]|jgi:peptidoglycan hydrolase-like protein with peptidoglycan-binding domain|nr:peptidoglycan-binding protein [Oculatellaceae cyanobacterium Prado106]
MTFTTEVTVSLTADITLRRGNTGNEVKGLQVVLNYRGAGLTVDGVFGAMTEARVLEFQQAAQLTVDGVVGSRTWESLRSGMVQVRIPGSTINMRATPERTGTVVQTLVAEDSVRILGRSPLMEDNYYWFYLQARQTMGWVRQDLVELLGYCFMLSLPIVNGITIQSRPRSWNLSIDPRIEAGIRSVLNVGTGDRIRYLTYGREQCKIVGLNGREMSG